ncbi:MAG: hypothetical protein Phog2KO_05160 [Phototrophicaceae bacterium]
MVNKILLIDDDLTLRHVLADVLSLGGYEILTADNGNDGVEIAMQTSLDLIICDYKMPEMDGYEVIVELQKNQDTAQIPIILATGLDVSKLDDIPVSVSTINKPFDVRGLLEAVEKKLSANCA